MNETVTSPANASLTCEADGVPAPTITWFREVEGTLQEVSDMVEHDNITIITITETSMIRTTVSTIRFFMTQPSFAAPYTCRASNLLGTAERVGVLTIHGELVVIAFTNREGNMLYVYKHVYTYNLIVCAHVEQPSLLPSNVTACTCLS